MHELSILRDLALIVGLAIPVVALAHRVRVPPLVGFLLVGVLIGPHGARLVPDADGVSTLAEVGVVLLLFEVGLELSLSQVLRWGATVLVAGGGQVLGTLAVAAAAGAAFGLPVGQSLFYGALIALSSTAIVTKTYADRAELDTTRARDAIAVLLFQDLAVVPLMLLLPVFAGAAAQADGVWLRLLVGLVAMTALVSGGRLVVRWTLDRIVETRDRELFTLCVGFFAIGTALVAAAAGFSLAIGAFLAGLIISESEHGLQALSDVLPFRALFSGVFFTSIGMLLDLPVAIDQAPLVLGATVVVVLGKTVLTTLAIRARGRSMETAIASGVSLAQIGEFSFVLAAAGLPLGLFAAGHYQIFLVVASVSMMVAPFLIRGARPIAIRIAGMATVEETEDLRARSRLTTRSSWATACRGATSRGCSRRLGSPVWSLITTPRWFTWLAATGLRRCAATAPAACNSTVLAPGARGSSCSRLQRRWRSDRGSPLPVSSGPAPRSWCEPAMSAPSTN